MYRIPAQDKKFSQRNRSDVSGNIWYSKNLDFDEEGVIKLSPRMVQVISDLNSDTSYDADFSYAPSIGRAGSSFFFATIEQHFKATLSDASFSITQDADTGVQAGASVTRGRWYQNAWHVSNNTTVYSKAVAGGTWTSRITGLTSGVLHPIEIFRNRNSIVVGDGNVVKQYNSSYSGTTDLTLPTDYEVVNISYSSNKVGVITKLSATASGQNQDAYFFVWDGTTTSANGGYPIASNSIVAIAPYKGSWVILSKTGQLLYFNGGGFEEIAVFPFFSKDRIWSSPQANGDVMITDGDLIYINFNGLLNTEGIKQEATMINSPGGIWCYDPAVGLYHKWSPSISQVNSISVADSNVDTTNDLLTASSGTIPETGSPIKLVFSTATPIGGLNGGQVYFVIKASSTTFRLATTKANAIAGVYINITSVGLSTNYFLALTLKDYGQTYLITTGGMVLTDTKNVIYDGLLASYVSSASVDYVGMTAPEFANIGYLVIPKLESQGIADAIQKAIIKYRTLNTNDVIILKYKYEEVLGIPFSSPSRGISFTWTSPTTLTTTADISEADAYLDTAGNELELEVIAGAGGGQMSQISSISESGGTYTITLSDEIEGVANSDTCDVIIDNWKTLGTITSANSLGYKDFPIADSSKWIKLKIILKGVNVTIEELQLINKIQIPSEN